MTAYRKTGTGWIKATPLRGSWWVRLELRIRRLIRTNASQPNQTTRRNAR